MCSLKMELEHKLTPKLIHRLRLYPQMRQAIHILQLTIPELRELVEQEFEENPLLELIEKENKEQSIDAELKEALSEDRLDYFLPAQASEKDLKDKQKRKIYQESLITKSCSLQDILLEQLIINTDSQTQIKIGEIIIGNINDNGYLECQLKDIAKQANVDVKETEKVLSIIQSFTPAGVGARDLRESLLIQLKLNNEQNSIAYKIVDSYLLDLEKKRFDIITKKLNITIEDVENALKKIIYLEPKPGRSFTQEESKYIIPELSILENEGELEVVHYNQHLPTLKVSKFYKNLINDEATDTKTKEYLKEKLDAGLWLIKTIRQRQETILNVASFIVNYQRDFITGKKIYLNPLTQREVADTLNLSESTISRAATEKYIQTPQGLMELKNLFSLHINVEGERDISKSRIKTLIKRLIDEEDHIKPLTDSKLQEELKKFKINIARRTVAKYRDQLKILPYQLRRRV